MLIKALFTTGKNWKQPNCALAGERSDNHWYVRTVESDSVMQMDMLLTDLATRMHFKRTGHVCAISCVSRV